MLPRMTIKIVDRVSLSGWDDLDSIDFPFLTSSFFKTLEESQCIGEGTGWNPIYITDPGVSLMYSFIKDQSYGEYIFDWNWTNSYHQNNISYYPKLTSMIPFTSVTTPHFLGDSSQKLMETYESFYKEHHFSSSHFLFLKPDELDFYQSFGYILRDSFQYHFENKSYLCFESFLKDLKGRKAKQIRKERVFPEEVSFKQFTGESLLPEHGKEMFEFYLSTISKKNAIAYLNEKFFIKVFERLKNNILYVQARKNEKPIAGAVYFYNSDRLYGRYWGAKEDMINLHFELCFYQGIEFCIKNKLSVFEAGAQGEHKISRGFRPIKTYSAHKFKHPGFHEAITQYIYNERKHIEQLIASLSQRLPFVADKFS